MVSAVGLQVTPRPQTNTYIHNDLEAADPLRRAAKTSALRSLQNTPRTKPLDPKADLEVHPELGDLVVLDLG